MAVPAIDEPRDERVNPIDPNQPPPEIPSRIIVVDQVSWVPGDSGQGQPYDARFVYWCKEKGDPCGPRRFTANTEWQTLNLGWVDVPGFLLFQNEEGRPGIVQPAKAERQIAESKELEISLGDDTNPLICGAHAGLRILVKEPAKVKIRCPQGTCRYLLSVMPK